MIKQKTPYTVSMGKFCDVPKGITVDCTVQVHSNGSVMLTISVPFIKGSETLYFDNRQAAMDAGWSI